MISKIRIVVNNENNDDNVDQGIEIDAFTTTIVTAISKDNKDKHYPSRLDSPFVLSSNQQHNNHQQNNHHQPNNQQKNNQLLLDNTDLWTQFYRANNEMIITKSGRCIFPLLRFKPENLDSSSRYTFILDFILVSPNRFRFKKGAYWTRFGVFFPKIKLTNRPRHNLAVLKMIKHSTTTFENDEESFFTFKETTFIAVTHYQNETVNTLKKNNNPHAKDKNYSRNGSNIIDGVDDDDELLLTCSSSSSDESNSENFFQDELNSNESSESTIQEEFSNLSFNYFTNRSSSENPNNNNSSSNNSSNRPSSNNSDINNINNNNLINNNINNTWWKRSFGDSSTKSKKRILPTDEFHLRQTTINQFGEILPNPNMSTSIPASISIVTPINRNTIITPCDDSRSHENRKLREFIRERYGLEAEKEADVYFNFKQSKHGKEQ
ncbi:2911_t:CDS:2 [Diversispora eburnea]|uniref:2911_t:CDS:1 n=1 Tax=Diversispora eburnea TaxID=1213867 RepID=A0A9N9F013_9GLOM|nr:2911_t:CDS:2 [Diversispora eburnea]